MRAEADVTVLGGGVPAREQRLRRTVLAAFAVIVACGSPSSSSSTCPNDYPSSCPGDSSTFAADVAPLMQAHCTVCHAPGQQVPTLDTYANIKAAAPHVLTQLNHCPVLMPPPPNPALTADQRKVILSWLACGAMDN